MPQTSVSIPPSLLKWLKDQARVMKMPLSATIRILLEEKMIDKNLHLEAQAR